LQRVGLKEEMAPGRRDSFPASARETSSLDRFRRARGTSEMRTWAVWRPEERKPAPPTKLT
jgi:hypothetical protein